MFFKRFRKPRPVTDAEFVAAYKATGDLEQLGELYERHMELVYAVCFKYLRDEAESKDAVMQLFEQLITDLKRHEVQNFRNWLHTVARNYCLMQLRRRKVQVSSDELDETDTDTSDRLIADALTTAAADDPELSLDQDLNQLTDCLNRLPTSQRVCVDLFYLQQKSYADVAAETGYSLKLVKSALQNGRRNLKLCLERHHD